MSTPEKQNKKQDYAWLKPTQFKPGQSGNPKGRPPGKSLKTFAREYLEALDDDQKLEYLKTLPTEIVWKMAEGNPKQDTESNVKVELPQPIMDVIQPNNSDEEGKESNEEN